MMFPGFMLKFIKNTNSTTNEFWADKIIGGTMNLKIPDDSPVVWMT